MSPPPTLADLQAQVACVQRTLSRLVLEPGIAAPDWAGELEALHGLLATLRFLMEAHQRARCPLDAQP